MEEALCCVLVMRTATETLSTWQHCGNQELFVRDHRLKDSRGVGTTVTEAAAAAVAAATTKVNGRKKKEREKNSGKRLIKGITSFVSRSCKRD